MEQRLDQGRLVSRVLLGADRRLVAAGILAVVFCAVVAAGALHPVPAGRLLARGDPSETIFNALIGSTITGVTIVLTLSQLILSQELGAVGDQRERMDGALRFREDVADALDRPATPAEPAAFLRALVEGIRDRALDLSSAVETGTDGDLTDDDRAGIDAYVEAVAGDADAVADRLAGAEFGTFGALSAALEYNYSRKLHDGQLLRGRDGDRLPEAARSELDRLLELLELFGPAREHVKTLYFQWELSNLSRALLVVSVPALAAAISALAFLDPRDVTTATLGVDHALLLVAGAATVAIAPFALLLSYVLRIVTVTKRTLSIGPFVLRDDEGSLLRDERADD
ncbi:hypothetical protein GJ633_03885 [Halorubrum sp. CBA1125]|uniref:hypothetical protein n=1 Tax=Halorubrum sp. CBA1125 TaxID=2668072 RepID=UPI0012E91154|nr:hypothetical protein [Halorubrum sp. CBA1125]